MLHGDRDLHAIHGCYRCTFTGLPGETTAGVCIDCAADPNHMCVGYVREDLE